MTRQLELRSHLVRLQ
ncbi:hypothetical protein LINPERHAP2_LOCUS19014 [Linum perenne]